MVDARVHLPADTVQALPSARLALRVIADAEGAGIAAQWLDDRTGNPLMTIIARRRCDGPWLVPTRGISPDQLALGLAAVLDAVSVRPGRRLHVEAVGVGRQSGLTWEHAIPVDYDALDPVNPSPYTVALIDLRWEGADVTRQRIRHLAERIRGRPSKYPTPAHPAASEAAEQEGSALLARAVMLIADEPENVLGLPDFMATAISA
jgi:hypothetical protein